MLENILRTYKKSKVVLQQSAVQRQQRRVLKVYSWIPLWVWGLLHHKNATGQRDYTWSAHCNTAMIEYNAKETKLTHTKNIGNKFQQPKMNWSCLTLIKILRFS